MTYSSQFLMKLRGFYYFRVLLIHSQFIFKIYIGKMANIKIKYKKIRDYVYIFGYLGIHQIVIIGNISYIDLEMKGMTLVRHQVDV